ncbi:Na+/H+ antiporter NhaA, partial [Acinetobacter baumannii]
LVGVSPAALLEPVPLGVALGLVLGKQLGIFLAVVLVVRLGWAALPAQAGWRQLYGVSLLCGIGFTMSLFIGLLAFPADPLLQDQVKIG